VDSSHLVSAIWPQLVTYRRWCREGGRSHLYVCLEKYAYSLLTECW